jgi:hypothetical protein
MSARGGRSRSRAKLAAVRKNALLGAKAKRKKSRAATSPPRIQPRHLFDVAVGDDDLFHGDRYKWSLRFTVINLTNQMALYNFLSTFSGTHYVTPRTETIELGFHF